MKKCIICAEPSVTNLDGDDLCQQHAAEWARGEGQAVHDHERDAAEAELQSLGTPISMLNGNAAQRHQDPDAWNRWCAISESWGY